MARFYPYKGRKLVSVTTFLSSIAKPGLIPYAAYEERKFFKQLIRYCYENKIPMEVLYERLDVLLKGRKPAYRRDMADTAARGIRIHRAIENYLQGKPLPRLHTEEEYQRFLEWKAWWEVSGFRLIYAEHKLRELELGYGGTLDAYLEREGKFYVVDWKTGRNIWEDHDLQNVAYRYAAEKMDLHSDGGILVHVSTNGTYERPVDDIKNTMDQVRAALALWRWANSLGRKGEEVAV